MPNNQNNQVLPSGRQASRSYTHGRCFVIQPFDAGKFDKRYVDIFQPAIESAGLEPYRVDQDPGVVIPIETIEQQISDADACFAEITTDNPNVWCEVGFALALRKPLCLVCSSERATQFPFDVRHRAIIKYDSASSSDFQKLGSDITSRLAALMKQQQEKQTIASLSPTTQTHGLTPHEVAVLALIMASFGENQGMTSWSLKQEMRKAGYTEIATGLAVERLKRSTMIEQVRFEDERDDYWAWVLTDKGTDWLLVNEDQLNLHSGNSNQSSTDGSPQEFKDEDIPF